MPCLSVEQKPKKIKKQNLRLMRENSPFSLISVVALSCLCLHSVGAITSKSLFLLLSFSAPSFPGNKEIGFSKKEVGSISQVQILKKKNQNNCWSLFFCCLEKEFFILHFGSLTWAWQDYPPNLSILFSGGKENNRDSLSQGRPKRDRTRCRIRASNGSELWHKCCLWLVLPDWRNSMCKADPLLDTTSYVSIGP